MKMNDDTLYTITVPCVPESFIVMEDLCETFLVNSEQIPPDDAVLIRLSVAEACRNALARRDAEASFSVASLAFYRPAPGSKSVALEITDPGAGLIIDGHHPPYPENMIGTEHKIASLLGQTVIATIESPRDVVLTLRRDEDSEEEELSRQQLIAHTGERGLGLLALCRCWEQVLFSHDPDGGNRLWLDGMKSAVL